MKYFLRWDTFFTCLIIFATAAGLYYVPTNFDFFSPLKQAIGDFDLTDMAQSRFRSDYEASIDTSIVLVNISTQNRVGIAQMLQKISQQRPKVIGIDAMFRSAKGPDQDSMLVDALRNAECVVLGSKMSYNDSLMSFDSLETSHPMFSQYSQDTCFFNVVSDQNKSFRTVREFSPQEYVGNQRVDNFAVAIARHVNPFAVQKLFQRDNSIENIRFRGHTTSFYNFDSHEILDDDADLSLIRDKIVLMGFIDNQIDSVPRSLEDVFFTPLNPSYAGRAFPDMYGIVVHANVVSQILHEEYINVMPRSIAFISTVLLCMITVGFFNLFEEKIPEWYDALTILIFLVQSIALMALLVAVFNKFHYKLSVTIIMASLALTPTMHEMYHNSIKPLFWKALRKIKRKKS